MVDSSTLLQIKKLLAEGDRYFQSADYRQALKQYFRARREAQRSENFLYEGFAYNNIGLVRDALGQYKRARNKYRDALKKFSLLPDRSDQTLIVSRVTVLNNLGMALTNLGQFDQANQQYQEALSRLSKLEAILGDGFQSDPSLQERKGQILHNMGFNFGRRGRSQPNFYQSAVENYRAALPLRASGINRAETLNSLGFTLGQILLVTWDKVIFDEAIGYLTEAVKLQESSDPPNLDGLVKTFDTIGSIWTIASRQNFEYLVRAIDSYEQSLEITQTILRSLNPEDRMTYLKRIESTYTFSYFFEVVDQPPKEPIEKLAIQERIVNLRSQLGNYL